MRTSANPIPIRPILTIMSITLLGLLLVLELTLMYPTLVPIGEVFHTDQAGWVITITLIIAATLEPLVGKLSDIYGTKRVIMVLSVLFLIGSVLGAVAPNLGVLIVARGLQGGALIITALAFPILRQSLPAKFVPIGVGSLGVMNAVAAVLGPFLSGLLVSSFGFRGVFWFCTIYIVLAATFFAVVVSGSGSQAKRRLDIPGVVLLGLSIGLIFLAIEEGGSWGWSSWKVLGAFLIGIVLLGGFIYHCLRVPDPTINIRALASRPLRIPLILFFLGDFGIAAFAVLLPLMIEIPPSVAPAYGFGVSAAALGLFYLPYGVMGGITGQSCGLLIKRKGAFPVLAVCMGALTIGLGFLGLLHAQLWEVLVGVGITGIGFGILIPANGYLIVERAPADERAIASTIGGISANLGAGIATPVVMAILLSNVASVGASGAPVYSNAGFRLAFLVSALVCLIGFAFTFALRGTREPESRAAGLDDHEAEVGVPQ
jgi:MFS family permease